MTEEDIIIHPKRGKNEKQIPRVGIFCANSIDATEMHKVVRDAGGEKRYLHHSSLTVDDRKRFFIAGPAVGAPLATLSLEKLIVLGAQEIFFYGWCGAISESLKIGEIVLGQTAFSGEGTSRYYQCPNCDQPSSRLVASIEPCINGIEVKKGNIWSTDAAYREDRNMLIQLREKAGVVGIDMEYSALCAVSAFRKIEFAAIFVVSDELLGEKWNPGFAQEKFKQARKDIQQKLLRYLDAL